MRAQVSPSVEEAAAIVCQDAPVCSLRLRAEEANLSASESHQCQSSYTCAAVQASSKCMAVAEGSHLRDTVAVQIQGACFSPSLRCMLDAAKQHACMLAYIFSKLCRDHHSWMPLACRK